jgi:cell wall-associated NlpC family hydrolase
MDAEIPPAVNATNRQLFKFSLAETQLRAVPSPAFRAAGISLALFKNRMRPAVVLILALILRGSQLYGATFPESGPTIASSRAALRNGIALAPADAPLAVKRAIWAANQLRSKPYRYGGGHRSFRDSGYDCSGTVSYALGGAGLISSPLSSSDFRRYGERGQGQWITVYARNGHTFAVIAGLRLDTTPGESSRYRWAPRWQTSTRGPAGFEARHPIGL